MSATDNSMSKRPSAGHAVDQGESKKAAVGDNGCSSDAYKVRNLPLFTEPQRSRDRSRVLASLIAVGNYSQLRRNIEPPHGSVPIQYINKSRRTQNRAVEIG